MTKALKNTEIVLESFLDINLNQLVKVPIIVIYNSPKDYPNKFVARLWDIHNKPTKYVIIKDDIESIRSIIPKTMVRLNRNTEDDPVIVETWL